MSNEEIAEFLLSKYKQLYPLNKDNISHYSLVGKHTIYIFLNLGEYTVYEFTYKNPNEYCLKLPTELSGGSSLTD